MFESGEIKDLKEIFLSAVDSVDPYKLILNRLNLTDNILTIHNGNINQKYDLSNYNNIFVFGAGKATAKMAKAIEKILGDKITGGIISVKYNHTEKLSTINTIEAGHPIPDNNSLKAGNSIYQAVKNLTSRTLVINLISGGGSALLEKLMEYHYDGEDIKLTLDDLQTTTKELLACGAVIDEVNCIRKHISAIKGGRLARLMYPATSINLILSDVVGDRLDSIASGLMVYDNTTYEDAFNIIKKYDIEKKLPVQVLKIIQYGAAGKLEDTPKEGDKSFENTTNIILGSNFVSLQSASEKAEKLGYNTVILTTQLIGEAKEASKFLYGIAQDTLKHELLAELPACIIAGGETTVTLYGSGKGGRNQEMALSFLSMMKKAKAINEKLYFLSASTDGNDGPTDAAGAFACRELLDRASALGLDMEAYLKDNDSYQFFEKTEGLLKIGPTNTNVCDIQIILIL